MCITVGSTIGGYLPTFLGQGDFSIASIARRLRRRHRGRLRRPPHRRVVLAPRSRTSVRPLGAARASCSGVAARCSGSAGTRSSGRTRSSARRGASYVSSPYDERAASESPRKLTYARPVEASDGGGDHGARPLDVRIRLRRVVPAGDGVEHERHRALRERRVALADPGDRAAHLVHVDLALRPRRRAMELAEPVDQLVVEAGEVRRLEVRRGCPSARAGRSASGSRRTASGRAGRRPARRPRGTRRTCAAPSSTGPAEVAIERGHLLCRATPPGSPAAAARSSG